ncbi:hypothetical protein JOB18_048854 [Solea senegalensis]|uniref:Uncharacterized protein n=1 Tax=Solea senegalensis TaxID=28829 RepID=A0AAV6T2E4_SOLSE|nr:hypothetical protein JOB18_048854 [Solea senegalensis]
MTETKANELICKLQTQIQDLNQPPQVEGGACECCQSELEQEKWQRKKDNLICELQQQVQLLKEETDRGTVRCRRRSRQTEGQ